MLASEAITLLNQTELKQLSVKTDNTAVLGYLNEAVLELHKRFNLWQDEAVITIDTGVLSYALDGVDSNVTIDLSDKQLILITDAYDYDGCQMSINDEDDEYGVVTPKYNIVEYPDDYYDEADITTGQEFSILFRASPIDMTDVGDTIDLPPTLFSAMYFYVGFRAHVSQKGTENLENNTHYKRFLAECNRVEALGLISPESMNNHKFGYDNKPWP